MARMRDERGNDVLLAALARLLGPAGLLRGAEAAPFETDWRGVRPGRARAVLRPASTEQVAACLRLCAAHAAPVVPQGGNTGLAAGATPDASGTQLVLSLARLHRIRGIDPVDLTLTAEAGVTLAAAREAAAASGCRLPLSIASEGTAQLGGVLSTNAGGNATLRHGNARGLVLGLEVVLPCGTVWHGLRRLRKDNTGYALRHLFVGAEGTLGVITAASLRLAPPHRAREVALAGLPSAAAALALLRRLLGADDAALHAYEYVSGAAMEMVLAEIPGLVRPLAAPAPHYALIELATTSGRPGLRGELESALAAAMETGEVLDAVIAGSDAQRAALWRLREEQAEAQRRAGPDLKHDISVPVSATPRLIEEAAAACAAIAPGVRIVPFGHLGDGNIHFNLVAPEAWTPARFAALAPALTRAVTETARRLGGSFSAEHGIGQLKRDLLAEWREPAELDLMRRIKHALDPAGLLNPGKLLP